MNENKFRDLFQIEKPIIGMIHLAGDNKRDKTRRALEELAIYEGEGVSGAIIEDYHGTTNDVIETLKESSRLGFNIFRGVNILRNPYAGFDLAQRFDLKFIQFDSIQTKDLNTRLYEGKRTKYPSIVVLGGVGFKYIAPTQNPLEVDLREGISKCEAIVTTGDGTGIETPLNKLREYKVLLREFPLVIGAGVNINNVYDQLKIADGAIIGSYFKPYANTHLPIDRKKVHDLMEIIKEV